MLVIFIRLLTDMVPIVIGGFYIEPEAVAMEVIENGKVTKCPSSIYSYPLNTLEGAAGAFVSNNAIICGGPDVSSCYTFGDDKKWNFQVRKREL